MCAHTWNTCIYTVPHAIQASAHQFQRFDLDASDILFAVNGPAAFGRLTVDENGEGWTCFSYFSLTTASPRTANGQSMKMVKVVCVFLTFPFLCVCVQDSKGVKVTTVNGQTYSASFAVLALPPPLMGQ